LIDFNPCCYNAFPRTSVTIISVLRAKVIDVYLGFSDA